jgi:hypothetical protein
MPTPQEFCMGMKGALDDAEAVIWQIMYTAAVRPS